MDVSGQPEPLPQDDKPLHGPYWVTPELYGEAEALNSMGTIAAPLLAGFSLAAMVQTLTITTAHARWPEGATLLFMLAAILFVASVQSMFWARGYQASPADIKAWWPDATHPMRTKMIRDEQKRHAAGFRMWANRARATYSAALMCLLAALTILAVPAGSHGHVPVLRWLAVAVGGAAFIIEGIWIMGSFASKSLLPGRTFRKWSARLLEPPPADAYDSSSTDPTISP